MCSLAAAVQGMDETVNNGAQAIYLKQFNITDPDHPENSRFSESMQRYLTGLIVGAPYLACAILGCWLTEPLNRYFARRGTIFLSCFIAAVASIWEGVANSWVNLFIARFVLGLGIGSKSSTVPVYAAECSPAPIRGALVMMWQMWTAFGIMLGNIMGVAFMGLSDDLSWRLMLGSTVVLPLIVCAQVYFCPESPRWLIEHNKIDKAFAAFRILRPTDLQAARDLYYAYVGVELERKVNKGKNFFTMFIELFTIPRNRRATLASWIVMFMQQVSNTRISSSKTSLSISVSLLSISSSVTNSTVLRRQRNRLLFNHHLRRFRLQHPRSPPRIHGHRHPQLGLRSARLLHNRHLGPAQSPPLHLPPPRHLPPVVRLLLLDRTGQSLQ
jgi:MFS family permease